MKKILVIDNSSSFREEIVDLLTFENFKVLEANNGLLGLQLAKEKQPDLIICDLLLPELNGYSLLMELKTNPLTAKIPFIFLSTKSNKEFIQKLVYSVGYSYLTKPFDSDDLISLINNNIENETIIEENIANDNNVNSLPNEFLTPLTAIIGFSELLEESYRIMNQNEIQNIAKGISNATIRLQKSIENLFTYSQAEFINPEQEKAII